MCIIIYRTAEGKISKERLIEAHTANPDGWGILWNNDFSEYVLHCRTASSGEISVDTSHPFKVYDGLAVMQNGNLYHYSNYFKDWGNNKTDIQRFNEMVLQKLPVGFLNITEIRLALEDYNKANFSKMIFMDTSGAVTIVNEHAGEWVDGVWYSNGGIKNYIGYGYSGAYYYNASDIRHKGGLISADLFGRNKKNWRQCSECRGWFHKDEINEICNDCKIWMELIKHVQ